MNFLARRKLWACMRGHRLVIDLSHSDSPGVLNLDIDNLPFAYFQIMASPDGMQLGYTNHRGEFTQVAVFAEAEDAEIVRDQIIRAFMSRGRFLRTVRKLVFIVVGIVASLWLLNVLLMVTLPSSPGGMTGVVSAPAPVVTPGMPIDADIKLTPSPE